MPRDNSVKKRAADVVALARARHRMQSASTTPSSSHSSSLFMPETPPETPPETQPRSKRIKTEDDEIPGISRDPTRVPENVLKYDPKADKSALPRLDNEQYKALNYIVVDGRNTFLTGSAGCGKSTVLRWAIMLLRAQGKTVYVIAPTGQAASQIGGITLHSYMGWNVDVMKKPMKQILRDVQGDYVRERISSTDVLFIDEISMVENYVLERMNRAIQKASGDEDTPFGGKQVIFCGDFCQLPPVKPFENCYACGKNFKDCGTTKDKVVGGRKLKTVECDTCEVEPDMTNKFWAFDSQIWSGTNLANVYLRIHHRQSEPRFLAILNKLCKAIALTPDDLALLRFHANDAEDGVHIFAKTDQAREYNTTQLVKLPGEAIKYNCHDDFRLTPAHEHLRNRQERSADGSLIYLHTHRYDTQLHMKIGMRLVLMANLDVERGLVNGSQGILVGFEPYNAAVPNAAGIDRTNATPEFIDRRGFSDYAAIRQEQVKRFTLQDSNRNNG